MTLRVLGRKEWFEVDVKVGEAERGGLQFDSLGAGVLKPDR